MVRPHGFRALRSDETAPNKYQKYLLWTPNKIYHSCEQVEPQTLYNIVKPFKRQAKYFKNFGF